MMYKVFLFIFSMLFSMEALAQSLYGMPSADNSFLGQAGDGQQEIDVDKFTGRLLVHLPLTQISSRNFIIPVTLSYTAGGGVRHQEYASSVGLGWQLVAGGGVTRVVRAIPDEFPRGYLGGNSGRRIEDDVKKNREFHHTYLNRSTQENGNLVYRPQAYDSEPDIFYVNTPTFSFQFTFDVNGNPVMPNETGYDILAINFSASKDYENSSFIVTDDVGNKFHFGTSPHARTVVTEELCGISTNYVSVWHLERIVATDGHDMIHFDYRRSGGQNAIERYNTYTWQYTEGWNFGSRASYLGEETKRNEHTQWIDSKYLSTIRSSYGRVDFSYKNDRLDVYGGALRLSSITTYAGDARTLVFKQAIDLKTSYFGKISSESFLRGYPNHLKLRLDQLWVYNGKDDETGYLLKEFDYVDTNSAFRRDDSNSDYFGYTTDFDGGNPMKNTKLRQPHSLQLTSRFMLNRVSDRNTAYKRIIYELNTFFKDKSDPRKILGGVRVKEILSFQNRDGKILRRGFQYEFDGISSGRVQGQNYEILSYKLVDGLKTFNRSFSSAISNIADINGYYLGYGRVREYYPNGSYMDSYYYTFDDFPDETTPMKSTSVTYFGGALTGSSISYAHRRGLLSKVNTFDTNDRLVDQTVYRYDRLNPALYKGSYGVTSQVLAASINGISASRDFKFSYYTPRENYRLIGMFRKEFFPKLNDTSTYLAHQTSYVYHHNRIFPRSIETTDSGGKRLKKNFYYPEDDILVPMVNSEQLQTLRAFTSKNIRNVVIHESQELAPNELIQTHHTYQAPFQIKSSTSYRRITSNQTNKKINERKYFYEGPPTRRLAAIQEDNGRYDFVMYDGSDRLSAELKNVAMDEVRPINPVSGVFFYEGFEQRETFSSFAGIGSGASPYTVPFSPSTNRKYMIDFWYRESYGTWQFKKMPFREGMVLNYGFELDEVRIYPEDAQIKTYTYNEIGLQSSESNTWGRTVFYEYDNQKRLSIVRDDAGNIVKTYCYNAAGEDVDCFANLPSTGLVFCEVIPTKGWERTSWSVMKTIDGLEISADLMVAEHVGNHYTELDWYNWGIVVGRLSRPCRPSKNLEQQIYIYGSYHYLMISTNGEIRFFLNKRYPPMPYNGNIGLFRTLFSDK